jgi:hypothetical protein
VAVAKINQFTSTGFHFVQSVNIGTHVLCTLPISVHRIFRSHDRLSCSFLTLFPKSEKHSKYYRDLCNPLREWDTDLQKQT